MYTTIPTAGMERETWLKIRKTGIGGSDAGAVCGLSPYANAMSVYRDKTSEEVTDTDRECMRQGRDLEEYVARRFTEATGLKVRRSNKMYRSTRYPFMLADVDRMVVGEDAGLECKTASPYSANQWKDGKVPPHYLAQCLHYMTVTGKREWYLAVVILGQDFQCRRIEWDEEMAGSLAALEADFWNHHVIPRVMPKPDGSLTGNAVLEAAFSSPQKGSMVPLTGFDEKLERRMELTRQIGELEREQRQIDQEVKLAIGEHEAAASERFRVSWSQVRTGRVDSKRLKKEMPEVYRDFCTFTSSRRFCVKPVAARGSLQDFAEACQEFPEERMAG